MNSPVFLETSFWDVIWWLVIVFVWTMVLWMFIAVFADIFRRDDHSGWAKAGWTVVIFVLPLLGILIYMIARPAVTPSDVRMAEQARRMAGQSSADELAKAQQLLQSGAITQEEFNQLKSRILA
jgi:hypothetical protein